jgi:beta-N-acetylhexosaminidase
MLIMGFNGCSIDDNSPIAQWLSTDGLGGVLVFDKDVSTGLYGKNLKTQTQIKTLINQLNHYASNTYSNGQNLPLLTAIDYEGGAVDRLSKIEGCSRTLNAVELAHLSDLELVEALNHMASTLKYLGFNLNFAPVVDLNLKEQQGIIGKLKRSFSDNPEVVLRVAQQFVSVFNSYGIACAYKHFPGHGSASGDTHEGFVDVTNTFHQTELTPYRTLLHEENKSVMVMTAHVINRHLDNQGLPATLSHEILTKLLRETMGFDGIIISDDLQMHAISHHYSLEEALRLTINAGADMLIFGNQYGNHSAFEIIDAIEQLVLEQRIDQRRIDDAFKRIVRLKNQTLNLDKTLCKETLAAFSK